MDVIEMDVDRIKPYPGNPRINEKAARAVAESIRRFGFKNPIILDKDGVVVAGHTRLKAAGILGMKTVPCVLADDLTPDEAAAFRLVDNKAGEAAEWDYRLLKSELQEIPADFRMSEFGFDDDDALGFWGDMFSESDGSDAREKTVVCPHCGARVPRRELIHENS